MVLNVSLLQACSTLKVIFFTFRYKAFWFWFFFPLLNLEEVMVRVPGAWH